MSEVERIQRESLEGNSKTSSGGSVLLEKVNENLESLLKAFEGRISKEMVLPDNLQEYPNPIEESHRLAKHMKLIRDTQTLWEAPPIVINRDLQKRDMLEAIDENQSLQVKQNEQIVPNSALRSARSPNRWGASSPTNHRVVYPCTRLESTESAGLQYGEQSSAGP